MPVDFYTGGWTPPLTISSNRRPSASRRGSGRHRRVKLTNEERAQILYNHFRLGRQPTPFLGVIQTHLEAIANHPGFGPELARRLGDPLFTGKVLPGSLESVRRFFDKPSEFLRDVVVGLDEHGRAALGLIYINKGWIASLLSCSSA